MLRNSVSWFIAIIVSSKSCVSSYEFLTLNLKSMLPNLNSSLISKPIQTLYQNPLYPVNVLQSVNLLNYLMPSLNPFDNLSSAPNYTLKSFDGNKHIEETKTPNIKNLPFSTNVPYQTYKQRELTNSVENYSSTEMEIINSVTGGTVSSTPSVKMLRHDIEILQNVTTTDHFMEVLKQLDSKFYQVSFQKLLSISPPERHENGISFAQSGLFLYLQLIALCTESDAQTVTEIKQSLGLKTTCAEQVPILQNILSTLPKSNDFLKFHWSSRFVLGPQFKFSENFRGQTASALNVYLDLLNKTDSPEELTKHLNHMIDADSLWAMHDTFEEDELSNGVCAAWFTTMYVRARWRAAPTVLNGSWIFYDGYAPTRFTQMIRINDVMRYVYLDEWDAEAIEIRYAVPELTFMILMPRGRSLKNLSKKISPENLHSVYKKMHTKRVAVILPIYTLRMTLLLPGKLEMMGLSRLVDSQAGADCQSFKLSHAVQRIMFWAEAGRNAFKDDGIEWDEAPELERVVDRPYIFFVRWHNITLLNGNFVL